MEFVYEVTDVPASAGPTPWQTVGPFFHDALPYDTGSLVVGADRPGAFTLRGRVHDGGGEPIPDALVEVWQADESGRFATDPGIFEAPAADGFRGFGRCAGRRGRGKSAHQSCSGPEPRAFEQRATRNGVVVRRRALLHGCLPRGLDFIGAGAA